MDIRWLADSSILINAAAGTLVMDPLPGSSPGPDIDPGTAVVTVSNAAALPGIDGWQDRVQVIRGPGEYEISGLGVRGIAVPLGDASDPRALNTVYALDAEMITVCHLGALNGPLTTQAAQLIGHVDVLITPAGGTDQALSADQAAAVTRALEPRVVIPLHPGVPSDGSDFGAFDPFVSEIGLPKPEPLARVTITRSNLGESQRLVLLRPQGNI
ncbi:MAG: MBL fold metallo-hydrolase [Dehalococcoidia bacterium]|jgi:L-ascorbate metabolism protein UlaG (beta-lactamase superfamily)|nr:MBL fold metallo-hydrolase [Dehalococcoidia bacterium]